MILELDCGNTLIKWRVIDHRASVCVAGVVESGEQLLEALSREPALSLDACRLVSVRSDIETESLCQLISARLSLAVLRAQSAEFLAGVRNGYADYRALGLDRWLAVVGAYQLARRACLILDLGTAVTADFVSASGEHLGGFICPGLPLMRSQLQTHTRRIRYTSEEAGPELQSWRPGTSTAEAVERGCALMLRSFAQSQVELARGYLGEAFDVFVTGGDAPLVDDLLAQARRVPDLVFIGLAHACPLPGA